MVIDHVGIAVKNLDNAIPHWKKVFGYQQMTEAVINSRQKVRVVFLHKQDSLTIKLIEPLDKTSPVYTFAMKGGGLHHICFKCENMDNELQRLSAMGLRVLAAPQPGEAFENENIAFIYAKQGLNIELISTDKKAGRLTSCDQI